jgi:hypothetical protein
MSLNAGDSLHPEATDRETRVAAEALEFGDAVALDNNNELVLADGTDDPVVYGVVGNDHTKDSYSDGDKVEVIYHGPVVANVEPGTGAGVELGSGGTDGRLVVGGSAKGIMTKYAEGEGPESIPAGFAHVDV